MVTLLDTVHALLGRRAELAAAVAELETIDQQLADAQAAITEALRPAPKLPFFGRLMIDAGDLPRPTTGKVPEPTLPEIDRKPALDAEIARRVQAPNDHAIVLPNGDTVAMGGLRVPTTMGVALAQPPAAPLKPHFANGDEDRGVEQKLLGYLRENGYRSTADIAKYLKLPDDTARLFLSRLRVRDEIEKIGHGPGVKWGVPGQQASADADVAHNVGLQRATLKAAIAEATHKATGLGHGALRVQADDDDGWTAKCPHCQAIAVVEITPLGHIESRGRALTNQCAVTRPRQPVAAAR